MQCAVEALYIWNNIEGLEDVDRGCYIPCIPFGC